jgi:rhamnosyl/mannosyltransferase
MWTHRDTENDDVNGLMQVLHVYKDYFPVVGGIENHIRTLCTGLSQEPGVKVSVLVTNRGRETTRHIMDGVPVTKVGRFATVASAPLSLGLFREIGRQVYDIVHLHFPYPIGELAYLWRGRAKRLVVSYHSDIVRQKILLRVYDPFLWRLLAQADRLLVSSPFYAQTSPYLGRFPDKCVVIPYGIDLAKFAGTPAERERALAFRNEHAPHGEPIVLFVGMLRYYKGVEYLIEAMRDLPAKLLILGEGPVGRALELQTTRLGLGNKVTFLGGVPDEDLSAVYRASDIFVLPSTHRSEAFGIVQLEAMASALPVISTELGTGTSYVNQHEQSGLVVPPRDPAALATAVRTLLSDPERRRQMGEKGRQRVEHEFSAPVMVRRILDLYRELLGESPMHDER